MTSSPPPRLYRVFPGLLVLWSAWEVFSALWHTRYLPGSEFPGIHLAFIVLTLLAPSLHLLARPLTMNSLARAVWLGFTGFSVVGLLAMLTLSVVAHSIQGGPYPEVFVYFHQWLATAALSRGLLFLLLSSSFLWRVVSGHD